jgi:NTE family protein
MEVKSERNSAERLEASRGEGGHEDAFANQVRTINLALQGGGAHGAFTWGVLDRLLDEKDLAFEGLSATSAGAMNAAAFAYGLRSTVAKGRVRRLRAIGSASALQPG